MTAKFGSAKFFQERSDASKIFFEDESLAHQEFKDECDIQTIMHRFTHTGVLPQASGIRELTGDFTDVPDYHAAMNIITSSNEAFSDLPAEIRAHFKNDPGDLLSAINDPTRVDELRHYGIFEAEEADISSVSTKTPDEGGGST